MKRATPKYHGRKVCVLCIFTIPPNSLLGELEFKIVYLFNNKIILLLTNHKSFLYDAQILFYTQ